MGIDWEAILGTSGAGLAEAYENTVADVIYFDTPIEEFEGQDPAFVDDSKHTIND